MVCNFFALSCCFLLPTPHSPFPLHTPTHSFPRDRIFIDLFLFLLCNSIIPLFHFICFQLPLIIPVHLSPFLGTRHKHYCIFLFPMPESLQRVLTTEPQRTEHHTALAFFDALVALTLLPPGPFFCVSPVLCLFDSVYSFLFCLFHLFFPPPPGWRRCSETA